MGGDRHLVLEATDTDTSKTKGSRKGIQGPFDTEEQVKIATRYPHSGTALMESYEAGGAGPCSWEARLRAYVGPLKTLLNENQIASCAEDGILGDTDVEEYDVMEAGSQTVHEQLTLIRTIERVRLGDEEIDAWYFSPYPANVHGVGTLFVCPRCLRYYAVEREYERHQEICETKHPPGNEIYRRDGIAIFEVDGAMAKGWCQNLCWFAKLFLDHKTLQYDVDPFLFYIVTQISPSGECKLQGFFSKEKNCSLGYNLACILTFPTSQRKGYGKILQAVSFIVTRIEGKLGSPEKPISDLGKKAYNSFWLEAVLRPLGVVIERWKQETENETLFRDDDLESIKWRLPCPHDLEEQIPFSLSNSYNALWRQVQRNFAHRTNPWQPALMTSDETKSTAREGPCDPVKSEATVKSEVSDQAPKEVVQMTNQKLTDQLMVSINDLAVSTGICYPDLCSVLTQEGVLRRVKGHWVIWTPSKFLDEKLKRCGRACYQMHGNDFCFVPWDMKRRDVRHEANRTASVRDLNPWVVTQSPLDEKQQARLEKIKKRAQVIMNKVKDSPTRSPSTTARKRGSGSTQSQDDTAIEKIPRGPRTGVKRAKLS